MIRENVNQNVKYWKKRKKRNRRQKSLSEIRKGQISRSGVKYLRYFFEIRVARYYYTRF
jgi:hypothetical protein